jgi:hypothetical protein
LGLFRSLQVSSGFFRFLWELSEESHPEVIQRSFPTPKIVLDLKKGISLQGITIIILTIFLPHTIKFQNPQFCGVSQ